MPEIKCRTMPGAKPGGKPRVYFTCHPADFEKYFDKLCEDIFKAQDCAIYYTPDMTAPFAAEEQATDLYSNNLFVVPVTRRLLTESCRAMEADIAYAKKHHIPILPFMMEDGIDELYSRPDRFGELQYLSPHTKDVTAIDYRSKLEKYLQLVLIDGKTADRVRAAFDAYIFLSYRKKDRRYANELMRLIHKKPAFRDIAIWYDEFLTPGESFKENIDRILRSSRVFALLVTPNLLEEPEGKPNFVMGEEYPMAKRVGMPILPAEMEVTDKEVLSAKFEGIPACVDPKNDDLFTAQLAAVLTELAKTENDNDAEHNFLIGLAYLEGIDVETDLIRGLDLIAGAAEADLPEAMGKLRDMYAHGHGVSYNYQKALVWGQKLVDHYTRQYGQEHPDTLTAMADLACIHTFKDDPAELVLEEKVYALRRKVLGEAHPDTLAILKTLSGTYCRLKYRQKELSAQEEYYARALEIYGEAHPNTLEALDVLSYCYKRDVSYSGDHGRALTLYKRAYEIRCKHFGEEDPETLEALYDLASFYDVYLKDVQTALPLWEKVHALRCSVLGEEDIKTEVSRSCLANAYRKVGEYQKAIVLWERGHALTCKRYGEETPDTLHNLIWLAFRYRAVGEEKTAAALIQKMYDTCRKVLLADPAGRRTFLEKIAKGFYIYSDESREEEIRFRETVYQWSCEYLGESHPDTIERLMKVSFVYRHYGEDQKVVEVEEKLYALRCLKADVEDTDLIRYAGGLIDAYKKVGDRRSLDLNERFYVWRVKTYGEKDPDTISGLYLLARNYGAFGDREKEAELMTRVYELRWEVLGQDHKETMQTCNELALLLSDLGKHRRAALLHLKNHGVSCRKQGEKHPVTLTYLYNLARTYEKIDWFEEAATAMKEVYESRLEVLGERDTNTWSALRQLAFYYIKCEKHPEALEAAEKLYHLRREALGTTHADTLVALTDVIALCEKCGEQRKKSFFQEALYGVRCQTLGEAHADTVKCLDELAGTYGKLLEHEKQLAALEKVYELRCKALGEENSLTLWALSQIAGFYGRSRNHRKALELWESVYHSRCKILGETHSVTLLALNNIAYCQTELGDYANGLLSWETVSAQYSQTLGEENAVTLLSLHNLGMCYSYIGDNEKAIKTLEKVLSLRQKTRGPDHKETVATLSCLAFCHERMGNQAAAEGIHRQLQARGERAEENG